MDSVSFCFSSSADFSRSGAEQKHLLAYINPNDLSDFWVAFERVHNVLPLPLIIELTAEAAATGETGRQQRGFAGVFVSYINARRGL